MTTSPESRRQRLARQTTLALLAVLAAVLLLETLWLSGLPFTAMLLVLLLKLLPLALFIPALRRPQPLTPVWLSALLLPYFCWAVLAAWAPGTEGLLALLRALLIAACIIAAMAWGWRRKA